MDGKETMGRLKFVNGRQGTGYLKMKLLEWKFFDLWILKYPPGSEITPHTDKVDGKKHWRVNFTLWKPDSGGRLTFHLNKYNEEHYYSFGRLKIFRSDLITHSIDKIESGTRYVLSFGFVISEKRLP